MRTVSKTVDELNIEKVFAKYTKDGGTSRYNTIMLLKVMIYCYMTGIYSSRQIAKQCRKKNKCNMAAYKSDTGIQNNQHIPRQKLKESIKERSTDCETVFGQAKANLHFRRFHLRGNIKLQLNGDY